MATLINGSLLAEIAPQLAMRSLKEMTKDLRLGLSEKDINNDSLLESIFWARGALGDDSSEYKCSMAEAFASSLYSDACKSYFTVTHLSSELVLSLADRFLTEQIILAYVGEPKAKRFSLDYFAALMGSSHLSEQIVLEAIPKTNMLEAYRSLELIPDAMVTPKVVISWLAEISPELRGTHRLAAGFRVKQVHPEYEGFPDEWTLKVFCGE